MSKLHTITVRDLEKDPETGGVFVLNNTSGAERGVVIFTVPQNNGVDLDVVKIPATFIPIELTAQVSKKQLLSSSELRKCVNSRKIILLDEDYALELLDEEDAVKEKERLFNEEQAILNINQALDEDVMTGDMLDPELARHKDRTAGSTKEPSMRVQVLVDQLNESGDETGALNSLRNLGKLEKEDYLHIAKKVDRKFGRIKAWAEAKLDD